MGDAGVDVAPSLFVESGILSILTVPNLPNICVSRMNPSSSSILWMVSTVAGVTEGLVTESAAKKGAG